MKTKTTIGLRRFFILIHEKTKKIIGSISSSTEIHPTLHKTNDFLGFVHGYL